MSQRTSALAAPTASQRPTDVLVVMAPEPDVPAWVAQACRRSRRQVRIEPAPGAAENRLLTIAALAGHSVLVGGPNGPDPSGTGRVVAAVRDLPSDSAVLAEAAVAADVLGAAIVPVHCVPLSFGERSVGLTDALGRGHDVLDAAVAQLAVDAPGVTVLPRLLRVHPHELVGEGLDADLLVLGGPRHRIPTRVGLVGCSAVQHAPCPVLLAARPG